MTKAKGPVTHIEQEQPLEAAEQTSSPVEEAQHAAPAEQTASAEAAPQHDGKTFDIEAKAANLFAKHEHAVLGGLAGLLIACMIFVIGFWKTMLVTLLIVAGVAVGQLIDGDPKIINAIRGLIESLRGTEQ